MTHVFSIVEPYTPYNHQSHIHIVVWVEILPYTLVLSVLWECTPVAVS